MKAVVAAFNQEKALVGAFSVIVQPVVEPMDRFTALMRSLALCSTRVAPTDLVLLEVTVPAPHTPHQLRVAPPPDKQVPLIAELKIRL